MIRCLFALLLLVVSNAVFAAVPTMPGWALQHSGQWLYLGWQRPGASVQRHLWVGRLSAESRRLLSSESEKAKAKRASRSFGNLPTGNRYFAVAAGWNVLQRVNRGALEQLQWPESRLSDEVFFSLTHQVSQRRRSVDRFSWMALPPSHKRYRLASPQGVVTTLLARMPGTMNDLLSGFHRRARRAGIRLTPNTVFEGSRQMQLLQIEGDQLQGLLTLNAQRGYVEIAVHVRDLRTMP